MSFNQSVQKSLELLQDEICLGLENLDGRSKFREDKWVREGGGGGRTRIIENGDLIEKGGVNFSAVHGKLPDVVKNSLGATENEFFACGVSIVLHPNSPYVPIIHMNVRYFELGDGTYWFGGGIDLTPHFVDRSLASKFHKRLKHTCDQFQPDFYPKFKVWADDYFFNKHRMETRGVGGIFYDKLDEEKSNLSKDELLDFTLAVGQTFVPAYTEQTDNRADPIEEQDREWQRLRRGRYVEFNLVYDRGTKFGLETSGRIESILMSLPRDASWIYDYKPRNSRERSTMELLKKGIDWI